MLGLRDNLFLSAGALRVNRLRASLTILGLTMGVATLITVMTLVQGANLYVEQKIANLGTNVFEIARTPFVAIDFALIVKALRHKHLTMDDVRAVEGGCQHCELVGAKAKSTLSARYRNREVQDTSFAGHTPNMSEIDTRTVVLGRYFTEMEDQHRIPVCLLGDTLVREFFPGENPIGKSVRLGNEEFTVVGTFEKVGSVLGQDQDNLAVVPLSSFFRFRGSRTSLTLQVKASGGKGVFEAAQDQARVVLRARRHLTGDREDDFFIATPQSYIALWNSISGAFFAVFVMVSSISAVVGGIVIMNVMLVSVTERTKEIGVRRAVGATERDILRQFLAESVIQCLIGGSIGVTMGFACALALRTYTSFPASVQTWVAILGLVLSSIIGLFFGIYPATKAAHLDPVAALRAE
ncbi:MAG: FtsX-like permease family protein [Bryobacterales bacterium]|nr:FtsX-like permease family protein [Bryobacterales bacterium]